MKQITRLWLFALGASVLFATPLPTRAAGTCEEVLAQLQVPKFLFDQDRSGNEVLNSEGIDAVLAAARAVQTNSSAFGAKFKNLEDLEFAFFVARLAEKVMFIHGAGGAAKTAAILELVRPELEKFLHRTLDPAKNADDLVGGIVKELAERGKIRRNTEDTAVDSEVVLLDEVDKGNILLFSALMELFSDDRVLTGNGKLAIKTQIQTGIMAGNATLAEFAAYLRGMGLENLALPLLNRAAIKVYVHNYLNDPADMLAVAENRHEKSRGKYLQGYVRGPDGKPVDYRSRGGSQLPVIAVNWAETRALAWGIFQFHPDVLPILVKIGAEYGIKINKDIQTSIANHLKDPVMYPAEYIPAYDPSTRAFLNMIELIVASAMRDFLASPLATEANLKGLKGRKIVLGPLSVWRAWIGFTTVGPGQVGLKFEAPPSPGGAAVPKIDFHDNFTALKNPELARDQRQINLMTDLEREQRNFVSVFEAALGPYKRTIDEIARLAGDPEDGGLFEGNFEEILYALHARGN